MIRLSAAPGSKAAELAGRLERIALQLAPDVLTADPYFREKLREHCMKRAMARYSEPVQ